jgi:hypothetical protein
LHNPENYQSKSEVKDFEALPAMLLFFTDPECDKIISKDQ